MLVIRGKNAGRMPFEAQGRPALPGVTYSTKAPLTPMLKSLMPIRILGIESSCDETAAAVVADGREILSSIVASQIDIHRQYGGVVPELASREHLRQIVPVVREALAKANLKLQDIDAI